MNAVVSFFCRVLTMNNNNNDNSYVPQQQGDGLVNNNKRPRVKYGNSLNFLSPEKKQRVLNDRMKKDVCGKKQSANKEASDEKSKIREKKKKSTNPPSSSSPSLKQPSLLTVFTSGTHCDITSTPKVTPPKKHMVTHTQSMLRHDDTMSSHTLENVINRRVEAYKLKVESEGTGITLDADDKEEVRLQPIIFLFIILSNTTAH